MKDKNTPAADEPAFHLVVVHPFGEHARGTIITEPRAVADVMAGENARHVNKIAPQ